jgi:titin
LIEYKPDSGKKWLPANKGQTTPETSFTVTDLPEGEVCEFRVTAENKAGLGKPSDVSEKVTVKAPVGKNLLI